MKIIDKECKIKDLITGKEYNGRKCKKCGSENIFVLHEVNDEFPDNINKDWVVCRCEKCRNIVVPDGNIWLYFFPNDTYKQLKARINFTSVDDAVNAWNNEN